METVSFSLGDDGGPAASDDGGGEEAALEASPPTGHVHILAIGLVTHSMGKLNCTTHGCRGLCGAVRVGPLTRVCRDYKRSSRP